MRYPELYVLRIHWVLPFGLLASVLTALVASFGGVQPDAYGNWPNVRSRFEISLLGGLIAGLAWAYIVARDGSRLWPARGAKRFGVLLGTILCLSCIILPELTHAYAFAAHIRYESGCHSDNYITLAYACEFNSRIFRYFLTPAFCGAGALLTLLVVARETSLKFALSVTVACGLYLALWISLSGDQRFVGTLWLAHLAGSAVLAAVQWMNRSSSWIARVNSVVLGLMAAFPCLFVVWATKSNPQEWQLTVESYFCYIGLFPFVHGNLARLRYLPAP